MLRPLRADEMAHDQRRLYACGAPGRLADLGGRQTHAVHSGVDMQRRLQPSAQGGPRRSPFVDFDERA